jgi:hypothetical protein
MQLNNFEALSSISAQNTHLQKANTAELSYQVKLDGANRDAVVEKTAEGYRAYVPGAAGVSVNGVSEVVAEMNLATRLIDLQA